MQRKIGHNQFESGLKSAQKYSKKNKNRKALSPPYVVFCSIVKCFRWTAAYDYCLFESKKWNDCNQIALHL